MKMKIKCTMLCLTFLLLTGCGGDGIEPDIDAPEPISVSESGDEAGESPKGAETPVIPNDGKEFKIGVYETGIVKDGYKQYMSTLYLTATENWAQGISKSGLLGAISYTTMIPEEYELFGGSICEDEEGYISGEGTIGILWPVIELQENQTMPTSIDDMGPRGEYVYTENGDLEYIEPIMILYDSKLVSVGGKEIFLVYEGAPERQNSVQHVYMTMDKYVFSGTFFSKVKYPEPETMDMYLKIISSIEIVKIIEPWEIR